MLTQIERDELGRAITKMAFLYGKEMPRESISMFISTLVDYFPATVEKYLSALRSYTEDSKNKFFPNPVQLREYLTGNLTPESQADETASRIRNAITKFGWTSPDRAREYLGELAWSVIERQGGWKYICENHGLLLDPGVYHAQTKNSVKAALESSAKGLFDQPVGLPSPKKNKPQGLLSLDYKSLLSHEEEK